MKVRVNGDGTTYVYFDGGDTNLIVVLTQVSTQNSELTVLIDTIVWRICVLKDSKYAGRSSVYV